MTALLHRTHHRNPSLLGLAEYRELEKQVEQRAACSREGALLEYETLELRVNPPNVIIENREDQACTHIAVDSANRPGTLVEVVPASPDLKCCHTRRSCRGADARRRATFLRRTAS